MWSRTRTRSARLRTRIGMSRTRRRRDVSAAAGSSGRSPGTHTHSAPTHRSVQTGSSTGEGGSPLTAADRLSPTLLPWIWIVGSPTVSCFTRRSPTRPSPLGHSRSCGWRRACLRGSRSPSSPSGAMCTRTRRAIPRMVAALPSGCRRKRRLVLGPDHPWVAAAAGQRQRQPCAQLRRSRRHRHQRRWRAAGVPCGSRPGTQG